MDASAAAADGDKYFVPETIDTRLADAERKRRRRQYWRQEHEAVHRWRLILAHWPQLQQQRPKLLKREIRAGIPAPLRGTVWLMLSHCDELRKDNATLYGALLGMESPHHRDIMKDVSRTFPKHQLFRDDGGVGQRSLYHVLKCYSLYDAKLGYCQGMGFVAGLLLCFMPEESAFWLLAALLQRYGMRGMWDGAMELVPVCMFQLQRLTERHLPRLAQHFSAHGVEPSMFAWQWFAGLFCSYLPFAMVARVWDMFLAEGLSTMFRVALSLLSLHADELMERDMEGMMALFKTIPTTLHCEDLLATALRMKVSREQLGELEREYRAGAAH